MSRDPRFDVLFEPVRIGPVTARNRFYQVPHCDGLGRRYPNAEAEMRGVKAEGGWAVVCTQECEIHWSSDIEPAPDARLWDDADIPALARMADAVHAHGALAGIELNHNGASSAKIGDCAAPATIAAAVFAGHRYARELEEPAVDGPPLKQERVALEEIAPEEIAPEEIAPEEIAPEEIAPEEIAPEEIAPTPARGP